MEILPSSPPILHRSLLPSSLISSSPSHPPLSSTEASSPFSLISPPQYHLPSLLSTEASSPSSLISLPPSHAPPPPSTKAPTPSALISSLPSQPPPPPHRNPLSILFYLSAAIPCTSSLHHSPLPIISYRSTTIPPTLSPLHRSALPILSYLPAAIPPASSPLHQILLILSYLPATSLFPPPPKPHPHPLFISSLPSHTPPLPILSYLLATTPPASSPLHHNPLPILAHLPATNLYPFLVVAASSPPSPISTPPVLMSPTATIACLGVLPFLPHPSLLSHVIHVRQIQRREKSAAEGEAGGSNRQRCGGAAQEASLQGSMKKVKDFTSNNKILRAFS